jgi:hypothetical protein
LLDSVAGAGVEVGTDDCVVARTGLGKAIDGVARGVALGAGFGAGRLRMMPK